MKPRHKHLLKLPRWLQGTAGWKPLKEKKCANWPTSHTNHIIPLGRGALRPGKVQRRIPNTWKCYFMKTFLRNKRIETLTDLPAGKGRRDMKGPTVYSSTRTLLACIETVYLRQVSVYSNLEASPAPKVEVLESSEHWERDSWFIPSTSEKKVPFSVWRAEWKVGRKFVKAPQVRMLIYYVLKNSIRGAQK